MSRFLITITPDNGGAESVSAQTMVRVDTSTGRARITELTVRSAIDGGLAPGDLPAIDMDMLIRALTATRAARPLAVEPATLTEQASITEAVAPEPASTEPATALPRRRGRKAAKTVQARKAVAGKPTGRKATAGKATVQKAAAAKTAKTTSRRTAAAAAAPAAAGPRAYRRMPEPEEVMDAYRQSGTIGGVAEHFNVPRHTVAGWARRLRTLGYTIGRQ